MPGGIRRTVAARPKQQPERDRACRPRRLSVDTAPAAAWRTSKAAVKLTALLQPGITGRLALAPSDRPAVGHPPSAGVGPHRVLAAAELPEDASTPNRAHCRCQLASTSGFHHSGASLPTGRHAVASIHLSDSIPWPRGVQCRRDATAVGMTLGRRRAFTHGYTRRRLTAQHAQRTLPMPEGGRYTHGEGAVVETTDARTARTEGTPMTRVVFRGNADPSPPRRARGGTASKLRPTAAEVPIPAITHNERPHDA